MKPKDCQPSSGGLHHFGDRFSCQTSAQCPDLHCSRGCRGIIAAPSFVWPEHIAGNCRRLRNFVDEVGLLFFESAACLEYTEEDLPPMLATMDLRFHVHLPLDLPWSAGSESVWKVMLGLHEKAAFLNPWAFILHPPADDATSVIQAQGLVQDCYAQQRDLSARHAFDSLRDIVHHWWQQGVVGKLLLENTAENDLIDLWPLIQTLKLGICLDLGHLLAYGQKTHQLPGIWPHVRMVHLSAPGPGRAHQSLQKLNEDGLALMDEILHHVDQNCVLMVEVFNPVHFMESLDILLSRKGLAK